MFLYAKDDCGIAETFINAEMTGYSDEVWTTGENCLNIPDLYESPFRKQLIKNKLVRIAKRKKHCYSMGTVFLMF